ncbi:hypothetical protein Tco_0586494 [Tanacetum coccineum]
MWDRNNTSRFEEPTSSLVTAMLVTDGTPLFRSKPPLYTAMLVTVDTLLCKKGDTYTYKPPTNSIQDRNNTPRFEEPTSSLVTAILVTVGTLLFGSKPPLYTAMLVTVDTLLFLGPSHHSESWNFERKG